MLLFDSIETQDHRERVEFYEEHVDDIISLEQNKQYYCRFHYVSSLFEIERFADVIKEIDAVIEYIFFNQPNYNSENPFEALLYMKACALARVMRYAEACNLMKQLIGINPHQTIYHRTFKKIYQDYLIFQSSKIKLSSLVLILSSAAIFAFVWMTNMEDMLRINSAYFFAVLSPCLFAIVLLLGSYGMHHYKSEKEVREIVSAKKAQKS